MHTSRDKIKIPSAWKSWKKTFMPIPNRTFPPSKVKWFTSWDWPFSRKFTSYVIKIQNQETRICHLCKNKRIETALSLTKSNCCKIVSYNNQDQELHITAKNASLRDPWNTKFTYNFPRPRMFKDQSIRHCFDLKLTERCIMCIPILVCILRHLQVYYELTTWPAPSWLDSSVGRALLRYGHGDGFESHWGLTMFSSFNCAA